MRELPRPIVRPTLSTGAALSQPRSERLVGQSDAAKSTRQAGPADRRPRGIRSPRSRWFGGEVSTRANRRGKKGFYIGWQCGRIKTALSPAMQCRIVQVPFSTKPVARAAEDPRAFEVRFAARTIFGHVGSAAELSAAMSSASVGEVIVGPCLRPDVDPRMN